MPVDRCMCRRQTKPCSNISAHSRYYKKSQISVFLLHNMLALSVGRIFSFADHLTFSPLSPLPSSLLYPLFSPLSPLLSSIPSPLFPSSLLSPLFSPLSPLPLFSFLTFINFAIAPSSGLLKPDPHTTEVPPLSHPAIFLAAHW